MVYKGIERKQKSSTVPPPRGQYLPTVRTHFLGFIKQALLYHDKLPTFPLRLEHIPMLLDTALYLMALNSSHNESPVWILKIELPGSYSQPTDSILSFQRPRRRPF